MQYNFFPENKATQKQPFKHPDEEKTGETTQNDEGTKRKDRNQQQYRTVAHRSHASKLSSATDLLRTFVGVLVAHWTISNLVHHSDWLKS